MDEGVTFREAATWTISGLAVLVSGLSSKLWSGHEKRVVTLETTLAKHIEGEVGAHAAIKKDVEENIKTLEARLTRQHEVLSTKIENVPKQVLEILNLIQHTGDKQ